MLAAVVKRLVGLPGIPESPHGVYLLAQPAHYRFRPLHSEAAFDMCFYLCSQTKYEAPAGCLG
jgi:hypothetical protein